MNNVETFTTEWGGKTLTLETGKMANLANGAVTAQLGETVVLATATMSPDIRGDMDYFPLMVDFEENLYAAGKIKGSRFLKRKGRPTDEAVINARITDRSLRPLFDYNIRNDIQVILNVLSYDGENDTATLGLIAASAALSISDIPWDGPVAGISVAQIGGEYILNPSLAQRNESELYLMMAVREDRVVMIESDGNEATEDVVYGGFEFAMKEAQPVVELIKEMKAKVGKEKIEPIKKELTAEEQVMHDAVGAKSKEYMDANMDSLFGMKSKKDRDDKNTEVEKGLLALFETEDEQRMAKKVFEHEYEEAFRRVMMEKGIRVDGRALDEVREITSEVDILPRTHGSALFQRGETQVLSTVTLGSPGDAQILDGMDPEIKKRYMHHYNFPPFSVGEVKPLRGPSRRDIGHGTLAEKALERMIPSKEDFPYTILVNSDVMMSNGSSSQASACGSSLSLMAAGVPIKAPVAGIAMGLVMTEDMKEYKILTDIQGVEDHSGDMDFKVAGTENGVTAIQLDIKLGGVSLEICKDALTQAKKARLDILKVMLAAIPAPRTEMSKYAPRIETITIDPERIGELIGPGGKVINGIIDETGVQIDIDDEGLVFITSVDEEGMVAAKAMVEAILKEVEVGEIYEGKVLKIVADRNSGSEIGAIVDLGGGKDGMVHISNVCHGRIGSVSAVIKEGEMVKVKVMEVDKEKGRIGLSRAAMIESGTPDPKCEAAAESGGGDRGGRSGGRSGGFSGGGRGRSDRPRPPRPPAVPRTT